MLVTWLALAAAFAAIGGLFFHRVGRIETSWEHLYYGTWAGIALTTLGLVVWHFLFPIGAALGPFTALAVVAIIVERRWFRPLLQVLSHWPVTLGAIALVAWTAHHALAAGRHGRLQLRFQAVR